MSASDYENLISDFNLKYKYKEPFLKHISLLLSFTTVYFSVAVFSYYAAIRNTRYENTTYDVPGGLSYVPKGTLREKKIKKF